MFDLCLLEERVHACMFLDCVVHAGEIATQVDLYEYKVSYGSGMFHK